MKRILMQILFSFFSLLSGLSLQANAAKIEVDIVVSENADRQEQKAAEQLGRYLKGIYPGYRFLQSSKINENHLTLLFKKEKELNAEGFRIHRTKKREVVLSAGSSKGMFNLVYALLEKLGYGFYLSYETKPLPKRELNFTEWELQDSPLQTDRIVFNWHNFLSGCTGWDYKDWCSWIDQSAKMRYNTIMVHAYGNNPMFSFEYNGLKKNIGYLTTSQSGRDWGAQHINDIRRLPGGKVFETPVFGSSAALVGDDLRSEAATKLMASVFEHADEMSMKINFAVDVDTWPANPVNIIKSLPPNSRIKIREQEIINPDTEAGYQYYKAQVRKLLTDYPQLSTITVWVRNETSNGSIWTRIQPSDFPLPWVSEWEQLMTDKPEMENYRFSAAMFAFSKIVKAYQKALQEINRQDVTIAFGSWDWKFVPIAAMLMPENCPLIPLDRENSLDPGDGGIFLKEIGTKRKIIPILWAHDDDHRYMGKPFTPNSNFNRQLKDINISGFGIIHWTTRPLDLFFKSLAEQVWSMSENKSVDLTVSDYSQKVFGLQKDIMNKYLSEWITTGPMFGRETTDHFFDLPNKKSLIKDEPLQFTIEQIKRRIDMIKKADPAQMPEFGKKILDYYYRSEVFYRSMYENQEKFVKAFRMLERKSIDSAKSILHTVSPEKSIELYADVFTKLPITSGEKALIISMGTRWLPDFINLKQRAGLTAIRYKFQVTNHDSLAQQPGVNTYFIDRNRRWWSCLGEKELKAGVTGFFNQATGLPDHQLSFLKITQPLNIPLVTIGKDNLPAGRYKVEIYYKTRGAEPKLSLISEGTYFPIHNLVKIADKEIRTISTVIKISDNQQNFLEVNPGKQEVMLTNLVITKMD